VAGTTIIAVDSVPVVSGFSVDTTNGQLTITPAPTSGQVVTAGFEFDIPARFGSNIEINSLSRDVRDCGSIDLIELVQP
jgi:uncharacterized protein (TIGR02217 family)